MKREKIIQLMAVRQGLVDGHRKYLDGGDTPDIAMVKQADMARVLEEAINQIDNMLREIDEVEFVG